ncbi:hypothetical protein [Serpentinimonas maccroryi]|uniref:hypothetical protein n=1 Tax=Serpentinimonas maccroryi TaxID=1458426 RepID=UPI00203345A7|nr:hypothetical protein [Serpentinimonas maccroryi]MCM2480192.1 hypothetical protein [Serpentinimonas maccroryi]
MKPRYPFAPGVIVGPVQRQRLRPGRVARTLLLLCLGALLLGLLVLWMGASL